MSKAPAPGGGPAAGSDAGLAPPGSPAARRLVAPGWLDLRLVLGVLLVLVSVVVGARVLSAADRTQLVWVAARDLAPGTVLGADDLVPGQVRLLDHAERYVRGDGPAPQGYLLRRGLGEGELLPAQALAAPGGDVDVRQVTVDVPPGHWPPDLRAGEQVDVYATPDGAGRPAAATATAGTGPAAAAAGRPAVPSGSAGASQLVLAGVPVAAVPRSEGLGTGGSTQQVVLTVAPDVVLRLVQASADGVVDLVRVPEVSQVAPSLPTRAAP